MSNSKVNHSTSIASATIYNSFERRKIGIDRLQTDGELQGWRWWESRGNQEISSCRKKFNKTAIKHPNSSLQASNSMRFQFETQNCKIKSSNQQFKETIYEPPNSFLIQPSISNHFKLDLFYQQFSSNSILNSQLIDLIQTILLFHLIHRPSLMVHPLEFLVKPSPTVTLP